MKKIIPGFEIPTYCYQLPAIASVYYLGIVEAEVLVDAA